MPITATQTIDYSQFKPLKTYAEARGRTAQTIKRRLPPELIRYLGKTPYVNEPEADAALFRPDPRSTGKVKK